MIIAALNESPGEPRAAITPAAVKKYNDLGFNVLCESGLGVAAGFGDDEYQQAGAEMISEHSTLLQQADILLTVSELSPTDLNGLRTGSLIIGPADNIADSDFLSWACREKINVFSMNQIPRISRAQNMDSLSSQASLAGYRAVLEAVAHYKRAVPMMMTAAGMIHPAKILVLGAGVAGLQAIATAKRLGAVIYVFDVRRAAREQVESLGAEFIEVDESENPETSGGYAQEMSDEYKALQAGLIDKYVRLSDLIICTALIPGKKAPLLITQQTLEQMKPGSVIVDLATARGGNCALSERDKIIHHQGITLIGYSNMAGLVPATASELYANNLLNVVRLLASDPPALCINPQDEITQQALLCYEGRYQPFSKEQHHV